MIIENIKKNYGKKTVLKDITVKVDEGKCVGILGGNGSGKSTLMSILAGVLRSDGGTFTYGDKDLLKDSTVRAEVLGYVPQSTPLIEELTAKDNLRLWYEKDAMNESLNHGVLKLLGVDEFINVAVYKMSGGMKKRLAIGCAVASNPQILLLDEPSAALDLVCKENIATYLSEFKNSGGRILLATHDIQELPLCDELYILKGGVLTPFEYDGDVHRLARSL